ncbi:MAG TPA: helix-turn-helix domain-containing protein [Miltoncostaeaceae bacterium]|nr:helix-turn-helix domain-containing protein [Miltoncostaeaceae bacterium]
MTTETPGRSDARRNREAILEAGRALFADSADVAMCQVARRAGVGQATLYRNFPDRGALAAEILGERIERIAELAADHEGDPDAFFVLLRTIIDAMAAVYLVAEIAREDARTDLRLKRNRLVIAGLMKEPLRDAKAAGTLRRDLSIEDVFLMLSMARGAMSGAQGVAGRSAAGHRALALMLGGASPEPLSRA